MKTEYKTVVVSYLYPGGMKYVDTFVQTIANQDYREFDVLLFLDDVVDKDMQNIKTISISGNSPTQIRFKSIEILKKMNYQNIIFCDIDDTFSANRIRVNEYYLEQYPVVCNDLNIMSSDDIVINTNIWSKRLGSEFVFDKNFLIDKNIVGFGNTGIKRELLQNKIVESELPIAADWFIFNQLLDEDTKCVFTNKCQTNYRQHNNNTAGLGNYSKDQILKKIQAKRAHYQALIEIGNREYMDILNRTNYLISNINNFTFIQPDNELFWWEEAEYLYEKN